MEPAVCPARHAGSQHARTPKLPTVTRTGNLAQTPKCLKPTALGSWRRKLSFPAGMLKIESSCDGTRLVGLGRSPGRHTQLPPTGRNLSLRLSAATSTCGARSLAASAGRAGLGLQSRQLWLVLATRVTR